MRVIICDNIVISGEHSDYHYNEESDTLKLRDSLPAARLIEIGRELEVILASIPVFGCVD